jgi:transcriptional regulator with XRE-family HTH domain
MKLNEAIGEAIRAIRTEKQLNLRDVSERSYVSLGHLSGVEMGKKKPSTDTLEAIAKAFELSTIEFMGEIYDYMKENYEQEDR